MKTPVSIRDYIRNEIFARRAQERGIIVIYDPGRRYRDIALSMTSDKCRVIDASQSVIEKRDAATEALAKPYITVARR